MKTLDKLTDHLLAILGLDLDFSGGMERAPFNAIADDLYLGARPTPQRTSALKARGITHVISCLGKDDESSVSFLKHDFDQLFIPVRDGMSEDIASSFSALFDFAAAAQGQNVGPRFLIHCEVGVSRSATLAIALQMQRRRTRLFETYVDVRAKRAEVLPNIGFASQLQRLEHQMHGRPEGHSSVSSLARYLYEVCKVPVDLATLQQSLHQHDYDAAEAIRTIFGGDIPRVVQGVRR